VAAGAGDGLQGGVAASRILVKRVGVPRKPEFQEEVWVGKAVNYAAKAAQCSNRREMWVTGSIWDRLESNDYIAYTCGCPDGEPRDTLWEDVEITRLPEGAVRSNVRGGYEAASTVKRCFPNHP
jgi:hypothetical protein